MSKTTFLDNPIEPFIEFLPDPVTCKKDEIISNIVDIFSTKNIGCIVIVDDDKKVLGIFTERDYMVKIAPKRELDTTKITVDEYMTKDPICVSGDQSLGKVLGTMGQYRFRHMIVTDSESKIEKVMSIKDALDYICEALKDY